MWCQLDKWGILGQVGNQDVRMGRVVQVILTLIKNEGFSGKAAWMVSLGIML